MLLQESEHARTAWPSIEPYDEGIFFGVFLALSKHIVQVLSTVEILCIPLYIQVAREQLEVLEFSHARKVLYDVIEGGTRSYEYQSR